jgi:hypothetical protein
VIFASVYERPCLNRNQPWLTTIGTFARLEKLFLNALTVITYSQETKTDRSNKLRSRDSCSRHFDRRLRYASEIYEGMNSGMEFADHCH